jgi:transcriptional regulator of arginine metabolism
MKNRLHRLLAIQELLSAHVIHSQQQLITLLSHQNYHITQATLSRDLRELKVMRKVLETGEIQYIMPKQMIDTYISPQLYHLQSPLYDNISISISNNLVILNTNQGFAQALSHDLTNVGSQHALGCFTNNNQVLVIIHEQSKPEQFINEIKQHLMVGVG